MRNILTQTLTVCATACALTIVAGCQSDNKPSAPAPAPAKPAAAVTQPAAPVAATTTTPAKPATTTAPAATKGVIRIKAGASEPFTDSSGNVWQADQGFDGGDVVSRDEGMAIANTKDPAMYRSEHYSMSSFSCAVPNGKYVAKLHFAETFEGVSGAGDRVFSFNVQGQKDFKNFDVFVKAGGAGKAYIETVPVEVTNGKFTITFTSITENPEINAIELTPQP
jgi:hypothetical protein